MLNWLRTKLRAWLGIERVVEEFARCRQAWWDADVERGKHEEQFRKDLSEAVGIVGKSLAKQIQELSEIDGNQPASQFPKDCYWQKTKLGGAIKELQTKLSACEAGYAVDQLARDSIAVQINRVNSLENPLDKRPWILGSPNGSVVKKKKRAKVKKRR